MKQLIDNVWQWAEDKGIPNASTPIKQMSKTLEECGETIRALDDWERYHDPDFLAEAKSEYGDILVTLIIGIKMAGLEPEECLQDAYDKISKRTGTLQNGLFVKDK